jgi:hypothetical protein
MPEELFSKKIVAGTKRTYYLDVKKTEKGDVFIQFSENYQNSKGDTERSRINIYKEDFLKFADGFDDILDFIKNDLKVKFY